MAVTDLIPWKSKRGEVARREEPPFASLQQEINRLFDRFWDEWPDFRFGTERMEFRPSLDVTERKDDYLITVEVPGIDQEDLDISLDHGVLTIQGEKKEESRDEREGRNYYECSYGAFQRSIPIPSEIDEENVEAKMRKGVLKITLPKTEEARKKRRQIAVKTS